jgi:hypothetical protein
MPAFASDSDANFYRLIHDLVGRQSASVAERRSDRRHPFHTVQQIAGWDGGRFPAADAFFAACCHDLTCRGFSFLAPSRPPFELLVAAFGKPPDPIFISAEVRHLAQVLLHASGMIERLEGRDPNAVLPSGEAPAQPMMLVGCRFLRRLSKPALRI